MSGKDRVAAFVLGAQNLTRVTAPVDHGDAGLESLRRQVARKEPGRIYLVLRVLDRKGGLTKVGEPLARWHVGEGFVHEEGWWVSDD